REPERVVPDEHPGTIGCVDQGVNHPPATRSHTRSWRATTRGVQSKIQRRLDGKRTIIAMDVMFRRATRRHRPVPMQLVDRALRDYGLYALPEAGDIDLIDVEQHYDARGGCFELIEAGGEVVGVVGWRPAGDGVIELKKLYLASSARGHGLGRRAIERVIAAAPATGARAIVLENATRLTAANTLHCRVSLVPVLGSA